MGQTLLHGYTAQEFDDLGYATWELINDERFQYLVTVSPNDLSRARFSNTQEFATSAIAFKTLKNNFYTLLRHMNRSIIGNQWQSRPDQHIEGIAVVEQLSGNPHIHCLMKMKCKAPKFSGTQELAELVEQKWLRLMPCGSSDLREIYDHERLALYLIKGSPFACHDENLLLIPEC